MYIVGQRRRSEAGRQSTNAKAKLHRSHGHRQQGRHSVHGGLRRLSHTAQRQGRNSATLVVREARQHDLLTQNQSALSVVQARERNAAEQILHEEVSRALLFHKGGDGEGGDPSEQLVEQSDAAEWLGAGRRVSHFGSGDRCERRATNLHGRHRTSI